MLDKQFGPKSIMTFDSQAMLAAPTNAAGTQKLDILNQPGRIAESLPVFMKNMYAGKDTLEHQIPVILIVPQDKTKIENFLNFADEKTGVPLEFNSAGLFINGKMAELLHLKIGDTITLQIGATKAHIPVAGIGRNYVYHYVYLTDEAYQKYFSADETLYNTVLIKLTEELARTTGSDKVINAAKEARAQLSRDLTDSAKVVAVVYNSTIIQTVGHMVDIMSNIIVSVFTIAAGALAFVVLYNLNIINIYERVRELATIKVLGFTDKEADMYIYRENIIISILGVAVGLGVGIPLHRFIIKTAEIESMMFVRTLAPQNFIAAALITAAFAFGINLLMHNRIKEISMVESLKSVE
jgi:putative ABC transport system permease protein